MNNHLKSAEYIANLLDNQFSVLGVRLGINGVIGLIPEIGDAIVAFLSLYLIFVAINLKLPGIRIAQMLWNIAVVFLIGLIPIAGDLYYIRNKANLKNLNIIKSHVNLK